MRHFGKKEMSMRRGARREKVFIWAFTFFPPTSTIALLPANLILIAVVGAAAQSRSLKNRMGLSIVNFYFFFLLSSFNFDTELKVFRNARCAPEL